MKSIGIKMLIIAIFLVNVLRAQQPLNYPYGKIDLKSGFFLEGKNLIVDGESVSLHVSGNPQNYQLEDVKMLYSGEKRGFNLAGAIVGAGIFMNMVLSEVDLDHPDSGGLFLLSGIVGITTGFLTPAILSSVGISKIKYDLLYSAGM